LVTVEFCGSVAVTLMAKVWPLTEAGGLPENVRVEALKLSQDGRAAPLLKDALKVTGVPSASKKVRIPTHSGHLFRFDSGH